MIDLIQVTDRTFDAQVFKPDIPVLVGFGAQWCGPCETVVPILRELAAEYRGRLKVVLLDVDQSGQAGFWHRVETVPTLILFANGQEVDRWAGALPKERLRAQLAPYLPGI
jgi:thioredoxin 1